MAKICLCLTAPTLQGDLDLIEEHRATIDMAELRVDFLDPDEQLAVRRFPSLAGVPTILTVRRAVDGGRYREGEGSRLVLLSKALAFAETDPGHNFAYVDLEDDFHASSLEESARTFGTKIIRSIHNFQGVPANLAERVRHLSHNPDEIAKAAVMATGLDDVVTLYEAAGELKDVRKILLAMGEYGASTRILADRMGSLLTYASVSGEGLPLAAPGQVDPKELALTYRFRTIKPSTRVFGIAGYPLAETDSPAIFNAAFQHAGLDAVFLPFKTDSLQSFFRLADELSITGVAVANPYTEAVVPLLSDSDEFVAGLGTCNTIVRSDAGWTGYNTDTTGFRRALVSFLQRSSLRGMKASVIGAGGAARAVISVLVSLGAEVCILNRTPVKAKRLADSFGAVWAGLDGNGLDRLSEYSDLIVQASAAGAVPQEDVDPLEFYDFSGDEAVFDLVCRPERTRLLARAARAGCRTTNGSRMLFEQAKAQYRLFTGTAFPA